MNETYNWIQGHGAEIIAIIGGTVMLARLIVKITPTPKDDAFLAKVVKVLKEIGLYIADDKAKVEEEPDK